MREFYKNIALVVGIATFLLSFYVQATAQQKPGQMKSMVQIDENDPVYKELKSTHDRWIRKLKQSIKNAWAAGQKFLLDKEDVAAQHREEYAKAIEEGKVAKEKLYDTTLKLLDYGLDPGLVRLAMVIHEEKYFEGNYAEALALGRKVFEKLPDIDKMEPLFDWPRVRQAYMEYTRDDYDYALKEFQDAVNANRIEFDPHPHLVTVKETIKLTMRNWEKELEIRKAEAAKDDLPRVEIETTKGKFVVELYENQAPQTVANFIHLVESGFYDGSKFDYVMRHQYVYAGKSADGTPHPGWAITDENLRDDARHFFGYTLGMKKTYKGRYPTSEFFITLKAEPFFDGNPDKAKRFVAFGRVIEGKNVIGKLKLTHSLPKEGEQELVDLKIDSPDEIISTKVIRKRNHEYTPEKLPIETGK